MICVAGLSATCINYARQQHPSHSQATDFVRPGDERLPGLVTETNQTCCRQRYRQSFNQASLFQGLNQTCPLARLLMHYNMNPFSFFSYNELGTNKATIFYLNNSGSSMDYSKEMKAFGAVSTGTKPCSFGALSSL